MGVNGTDKTYYRAMAPLIGQRPELPTGCEITATTMMLQFAGANVTKLSLAKEMPRSSDPNKASLAVHTRHPVGTFTPAADGTGEEARWISHQYDRGQPDKS